jgi:hypothetical protein
VVPLKVTSTLSQEPIGMGASSPPLSPARTAEAAFRSASTSLEGAGEMSVPRGRTYAKPQEVETIIPVSEVEPANSGLNDLPEDNIQEDSRYREPSAQALSTEHCIPLQAQPPGSHGISRLASRSTSTRGIPACVGVGWGRLCSPD